MGSRVLYAIPLMIMSWGIPQQLYAEEVKPEVVAEASVPRAAPLVRHLHLLSPSKESYLNPSWPIVKIGLQPADIFFDLQKLGYEDVKEISNPPSDWEIKQYKKIIAQIDAEAANLSTNEDISKEKARLKTHLSLILTLSGSRDLAKETHKALKSAIANTKEPEILLPLVYNLGLLYLHSGYFREAADLAHQYEARYEKEKQWVGFFRSLTIESYFARGRYLRAEDYLWDLATKIGKEDLIPHLALRYADSLFWQQKYAAVVEWYKNTQVQSYLDDSNALRKLSRLYYAESLFQTGQYDEAREQFNLFKNTRAEGEAVLDMLTYRLLECDITGEPDLKKSAARLYTFALKESVGNLQSVALTEWARLLVKSGDADLNMLTSAHALLNSHSLKKLPVPLLKELLMSRAMLEYSMNDKKAALATLARIVPTKYVRDVLDPFIRELADISTALLEELAPTYWDTKDYAGFLIECDRFSQMIQMSKEKDGVLIWVGRGYIDTGMAASATRLFERLIFEQNSNRRARLGLELARAYGSMGQSEAMGKALELVSSEPTDPAERNLYYLTRGTYHLAVQDYQACLTEFDQLMQKGVQGDDFFELAYQTSVCARKAHSFEKAEQYLALLGMSDDKLSGDSLPETTKDWQKKALYEKINLLVDKDDHAAALAIFQKIKAAQPEAVPPLETIFLLVKSYRQQEAPDEAVKLWKEYAERSKAVPQDFKDEYAKLLELLGKAELVPSATGTL